MAGVMMRSGCRLVYIDGIEEIAPFVLLVFPRTILFPADSIVPGLAGELSIPVVLLITVEREICTVAALVA
jgi:hypothetical protein